VCRHTVLSFSAPGKLLEQARIRRLKFTMTSKALDVP
jgi:hypothetical protein